MHTVKKISVSFEPPKCSYIAAISHFTPVASMHLLKFHEYVMAAS